MLDGVGFGDAPEPRARALFAAGADWIQLRDRTLPDARLLALARALVAARDAAIADPGQPRRERLRVLVNRRVDVARAAQADGVHLGFDALAAEDARSLLGASARIGRSLHSVDEVRAAATGEARPDYVHLAPIWDPLSKPAERPALGVAALRAAAQTGLPVFAQGGLDPARTVEAIAAGAAGIAVTGALARGGAPEALLLPLREHLDVARQPPVVAQELREGGSERRR